MATGIALIFLLALAVEGTIEHFGSPLPPAYKPYAALALAIALCIGYNADLFFLLGWPAAYPLVGQLVTAVTIARGSNAINALINRAQVVPAPSEPVSEVVGK